MTTKISLSDELTQAEPMAAGKRKLMDAASFSIATQLASDALSLRDIAKAAGLNHNTFYRHFKNADQLLVELMHEYGEMMRRGVSNARAQVPLNEIPTRKVLQWLFGFARKYEYLFVTAYRVLHGPESPARTVVEEVLQDLVVTMTKELTASGVLPQSSEIVCWRVLESYIRTIFDLLTRQLEGATEERQVLAICESLMKVLIQGLAYQEQK